MLQVNDEVYSRQPFAEGTGVHRVVESDKGRLESVLTNFIKNTIKFTRKGKVIVGLESSIEQLKVYARDSGKGVEEAVNLGVNIAVDLVLIDTKMPGMSYEAIT